MSRRQYTNQYPAELASNLTPGATTLVLKSGHGNLAFPEVPLGQDKHFIVVAKDKFGNREVIKCIMRAGGSDTLVVGTSMAHQPSGSVAGRAQEGTTALAITASDDHVIELRLTAGIMQDIENRLSGIEEGGLGPDLIGDASADLDAMKATADPYPAGAPSLAVALLGEILRLRYIIAQITGEDFWYVDPDSSIAAIVAGYYTKANLETSGQASVHAGNLSSKNSIKHTEINNDEPTKHREINDGAAGSTNLWSASKINSELGARDSSLNTHKGSGDHDSRYYTEAEMNGALAGKSDTGHTHDSRYYTQGQVYTRAETDAAIAAAIAAHAGGGGGDGT